MPSLSLAAFLLTAAAAVPRNPTSEMFPQRFSVHTGTTIPLNDGWDSITQSGEVHYDGTEQWLRMDHKSTGKDVSFIARFGEGQLYLLVDGKCVNVTVNGSLMPFATPKGSVLNQERALVRDTIVVNYNGVIRGMNGKLHALDFFVKKENRTSDGDRGNWIPWRTTYSRLFRKEIGPMTDKQRNNREPQDDEDDSRDWRFFGEGEPDPLEEEVSQYQRPPQAVATFDPGNGRVITDYYNFKPYPPSKDLFEPPAVCQDAPAASDVKFSFADHGGYGQGHQIFEFQKALSDLTTDFPHLNHHLLEDACLRYFCDASEKESSKDARPIFNGD